MNRRELVGSTAVAAPQQGGRTLFIADTVTITDAGNGWVRKVKTMPARGLVASVYLKPGSPPWGLQVETMMGMTPKPGEDFSVSFS